MSTVTIEFNSASTVSPVELFWGKGDSINSETTAVNVDGDGIGVTKSLTASTGDVVTAIAKTDQGGDPPVVSVHIKVDGTPISGGYSLQESKFAIAVKQI
jgi:hypothetical protein